MTRGKKKAAGGRGSWQRSPAGRNHRGGSSNRASVTKKYTGLFPYEVFGYEDVERSPGSNFHSRGSNQRGTQQKNRGRSNHGGRGRGGSHPRGRGYNQNFGNSSPAMGGNSYSGLSGPTNRFEDFTVTKSCTEREPWFEQLPDFNVESNTTQATPAVSKPDTISRSDDDTVKVFNQRKNSRLSSATNEQSKFSFTEASDVRKVLTPSRQTSFNKALVQKQGPASQESRNVQSGAIHLFSQRKQSSQMKQSNPNEQLSQRKASVLTGPCGPEESSPSSQKVQQHLSAGLTEPHDATISSLDNIPPDNPAESSLLDTRSRTASSFPLPSFNKDDPFADGYIPTSKARPSATSIYGKASSTSNSFRQLSLGKDDPHAETMSQSLNIQSLTALVFGKASGASTDVSRQISVPSTPTLNIQPAATSSDSLQANLFPPPYSSTAAIKPLQDITPPNPNFSASRAWPNPDGRDLKPDCADSGNTLFCPTTTDRQKPSASCLFRPQIKQEIADQFNPNKNFGTFPTGSASTTNLLGDRQEPSARCLLPGPQLMPQNVGQFNQNKNFGPYPAVSASTTNLLKDRHEPSASFLPPVPQLIQQNAGQFNPNVPFHNQNFAVQAQMRHPTGPFPNQNFAQNNVPFMNQMPNGFGNMPGGCGGHQQFNRTSQPLLPLPFGMVPPPLVPPPPGNVPFEPFGNPSLFTSRPPFQTSTLGGFQPRVPFRDDNQQPFRGKGRGVLQFLDFESAPSSKRRKENEAEPSNTAQGQVSFNTVQGQASVNTVQGQASSNTVQGQASVNTVQGQASSNTVQGQASSNTVQGQASINTVQGQASFNTVQGQASSNTVQGQASINTVQGQASSNTVQGQASSFEVKTSNRDDTSRKSIQPPSPKELRPPSPPKQPSPPPSPKAGCPSCMKPRRLAKMFQEVFKGDGSCKYSLDTFKNKDSLRIIQSVPKPGSDYFWAIVQTKEQHSSLLKCLAKIKQDEDELWPYSKEDRKGVLKKQGNYFRVWLEKELPNDQLRVFCLDSGKTEDVDEEQVFFVPDDSVFKMPPCAVPCKFWGIQEVSQEWCGKKFIGEPLAEGFLEEDDGCMLSLSSLEFK